MIKGDRFILATKSGWLIPVELVKETKLYYHVNEYHEDKLIKVKKTESSSKLFNTAEEAGRWIFEEYENENSTPI